MATLMVYTIEDALQFQSLLPNANDPRNAEKLWNLLANSYSFVSEVALAIILSDPHCVKSLLDVIYNGNTDATAKLYLLESLSSSYSLSIEAHPAGGANIMLKILQNNNLSRSIHYCARKLLYGGCCESDIDARIR